MTDAHIHSKPPSPSSRTFDFDSNQFSASVEVGREYATAKPHITVTPHVGLNYLHYDADSYTDPLTSLVVEQEELNVLEAEIGATVDYEKQNADGSTFNPFISAEFGYDFIGDEVETTGSFNGGTSFTTEGYDSQDTRFSVGTGFTLMTTQGVDVTAEYTYDLKEDYSAHSGLLEAAYKF